MMAWIGVSVLVIAIMASGLLQAQSTYVVTVTQTKIATVTVTTTVQPSTGNAASCTGSSTVQPSTITTGSTMTATSTMHPSTNGPTSSTANISTASITLSNATPTLEHVSTTTVPAKAVAMTTGEKVGTAICVFLFVLIILLTIVVVVLMRRMNVACFAGRHQPVKDNGKVPVSDLAAAKSGGRDAAHMNKAFEDSEYDTYDDTRNPYNGYAGLEITGDAKEDQTYEELDTPTIETQDLQ